MDTTHTFVDEQPQPRYLPIALGGGLNKCVGCGKTFTVNGWNVKDRGNSWCRRCALDHTAYRHWQKFCDLSVLIDDLMIEAPDASARRSLAQMLGDCADHFSAWRWPEENP